MSRAARANVLCIAMVAIGIAGCRTGGDPAAAGGSSFSSPEAAVEAIRPMLREARWAELAGYYDLSGSRLAPADLASGGFFLNPQDEATQLPPPERELAKYRHPFHPAFTYGRTIPTADPDVVVVQVALEIDQGAGQPARRTFDHFKMRRTGGGWKLLPDEVTPEEAAALP